MTKPLHLGEVNLPHETVTETIAILGKRGAGKTTTARVIAEELLTAELPIVVLDPTGVWWGLRSSADGQSEGFPIIIFGGDHADVPLEPNAGTLIADVIIDERIPAVLDLSTLSKTAMRSFVAVFLERLYHRNRQALHVIVDEADLFAPQRLPKGAERLYGAMDDLVRRGRVRGLGVSLITQRPQVLNKDVLSQCEVLIAMRMVGTRDVAAIDDWVRLHADEEEARTVKASLPSLPIGTAWVWSPGWLGLLERIKVQRPTTYDSSATPKPGQQRKPVKRMASVDLAALGERIEATAERAKAEDPKLLRAEIAKLRRELAAKKAPETERVEIVEVEVEVERIPPAVAEVLARTQSVLGSLVDLAVTHRDLVSDYYDEIQALLTAEPRRARPQPVRKSVESPRPTRPDNRTYREPPAQSAEPSSNGIPPARQRLLDSLASLEGIGVRSVPKVQLALWASVSPKSSGYTNNLGALRSLGLIEYPTGGRVALTGAGRKAAASTLQLQTVDELHEHVRYLLSPSRWRIVEPLIATYPNAVPKVALAEMAGVSPSSSGYTNNLGALRSLGLIDYPSPGMVAATPVLFLEG